MSFSYLYLKRNCKTVNFIQFLLLLFLITLINIWLWYIVKKLKNTFLETYFAFSNYRKMKYSSSDSSHWDESNGSNHMSLGTVDQSQIGKMPTDQHSYSKAFKKPFFNWYITPRDIKLLPLDSSW